MPMPGEPNAYEGDCGVTESPTKTVAGSAGGAGAPEGMHEVPFAGGGEKNILDGGGGHGGFVLGDTPD